MRLANPVSSWVAASPLRLRRYRHFYFGSIGAALGYTMQASMAAWLMTTLTPSPLMVGLVQTASTAPALVFGLIAGSLADIVDRRRMIVGTQVALVVATLTLAIATWADIIGPVMLLALTFFIGAGFVFYMPAAQATTNDLVPLGDVPTAVALGAIAFNVSRAAGPAFAGVLAGWFGMGSALLVSALMFTTMIWAARGWRSPTTTTTPGIPETVLSGVQSGLRYALNSRWMHAVIIQGAAFSLCASALWALLPVVARDLYSFGATGYGMLLACFGGGAVVGALGIPRHMKRVALHTVVNWGVIAWAGAVALLAWSPHPALGVIGTFIAGGAWVSVFASLTAGAQSSAPAWVRARAAATQLVSSQAFLALGGFLWGWLASLASTSIALACSAGLMLVCLLFFRRFRVSMGNESDVTPAVQLPDLAIAVKPMPDDGPVLIQYAYRIDPGNREDFLQAIEAVGPVRRRNGASSWRIFRDLAEEGRYVERFIVTSWAEYVRLRSRSTVTDRQILERVAALQRSDIPLNISRLIGIEPRTEGDDRPADAK